MSLTEIYLQFLFEVISATVSYNMTMGLFDHSTHKEI
jgi:hypothetical protein